MIPNKVGLGLRSKHYKDILDNKAKVSWLEVHSENYFSDGGLPHYYLKKINNMLPISFHGVGLSLGSAEPVNMNHLKKLKKLFSIYNPSLISEHLSWSSIDNRYFNDLLPLLYTDESFKIFCDKVKITQDYLGRQILIENPSSYISYKSSNINEWDFYSQIPNETGCGLLLDINNIYVSCQNHNYNPEDYLNAINTKHIQEYHLAGYSTKKFDKGTILIDDHGSKVKDPVWNLFHKTIKKLGAKPTLIEWDTNIPSFTTLLEEATKAQNILDKHETKY